MAVIQETKLYSNLQERVVSMQGQTEEIIGVLGEMVVVGPQEAQPDVGGPGAVDLLTVRLQDLAGTITVIGRSIREIADRIGSA